MQRNPAVKGFQLHGLLTPMENPPIAKLNRRKKRIAPFPKHRRHQAEQQRDRRKPIEHPSPEALHSKQILPRRNRLTRPIFGPTGPNGPLFNARSTHAQAENTTRDQNPKQQQTERTPQATGANASHGSILPTAHKKLPTGSLPAILSFPTESAQFRIPGTAPARPEGHARIPRKSGRPRRKPWEEAYEKYNVRRFLSQSRERGPGELKTLNNPDLRERPACQKEIRLVSRVLKPKRTAAAAGTWGRQTQPPRRQRLLTRQKC